LGGMGEPSHESPVAISRGRGRQELADGVLGYGAARARGHGDEERQKNEGDTETYLTDRDVATVAVDAVSLAEEVDGRAGGSWPGVWSTSIGNEK
jgi:hypothetical protein